MMGGSVGCKIHWVNLHENLVLFSCKDSRTDEGENNVGTENKFWHTSGDQEALFGTDNLGSEHCQTGSHLMTE